jgi:hypothetical protein
LKVAAFRRKEQPLPSSFLTTAIPAVLSFALVVVLPTSSLMCTLFSLHELRDKGFPQSTLLARSQQRWGTDVILVVVLVAVRPSSSIYPANGHSAAVAEGAGDVLGVVVVVVVLVVLVVIVVLAVVAVVPVLMCLVLIVAAAPSSAWW